MPNFDEMSDMIDEDTGDCFVENFVIGREGYGNVLFPGTTNVAGLNLDDIGALSCSVEYLAHH